MTDITPRISHLPRDQWTDDAREVFAFWGAVSYTHLTLPTTPYV